MQGGGYSPSPGYGLTATSATTTGSGPQGSTSRPSTTSQRQPLAVEGDTAAVSHLDSFFAQSAWTREDVLVVAAVVQLVAWTALLYIEVNDG